MTPLHHIMACLELIDIHKTDEEINQTFYQYKLELTLEMICMAQQTVTWKFHFPCSSHQKADVEIEISTHHSREKQCCPILRPLILYMIQIIEIAIQLIFSQDQYQF